MLYVNPMDANVDRISSQYRDGIGRTDGKANPAREKKALEEYERLFLYQLLREMRKSVPDDPLLGKSGEQDYMQEMLDDHYAGVMAKSGQFGIAKEMEAQMRAPKHVDMANVTFKPLSKVKLSY